MHVKLHISVCGPFMWTGLRRCFFLSLICWAYAFRSSGDRREFILLNSSPPPRLLWRVATVYVVPSQYQGGAKKSTRILPSSFCLSEQLTMLWEGG